MGSNTKDNKQGYIVVMSKKPTDAYEHVVSTLIGPYVHSASSACMLSAPSTPEHEKNRMLFYALANEPFGCKLISPEMTTMDHDYVAILIPVHPMVVDSYRAFMCDLWYRKVAYNSKDTMLCLTHGGGKVTNMIFQDTNCHNVTSVFCSQAVVLGLRKALQDNCSQLTKAEKSLLKAVQCNSRATDPSSLFKLLVVHGKLCSATAARKLLWVNRHQLENIVPDVPK